MTAEQKANRDLKNLILADLPNPITVPAIMSAMASAYATIDEHTKRWKNETKPKYACNSGCSYCCHQSVWVTEPEAIYIAECLRETYPGNRIHPIVDWIVRSAEQTSGLDVSQRHRLRQPCPFLDHGICVIYPARPSACRSLYSVEARLCQDGLNKDMDIPYLVRPGELAMRIRAAVISALFDRGVICRTLELNAAMRVALCRPDAGAEWLSGKSPFITAIPPDQTPDIIAMSRAATGDL